MIACLVILTACDNAKVPIKNNITSKAQPKITSIKYLDGSIKVEPEIITQNKNLKNFVIDLQNSKIQLSNKISILPNKIQTFLDQYSKDGFTMAAVGGPWNCCCFRDDKLPNRQLVCNGNDGHLFLISYLTGGIGVSSHLILIKYENDRVIDFWFCNTLAKLEDKEGIIKYLLTSKEVHNTMSI
jgi:hypothetical protein